MEAQVLELIEHLDRFFPAVAQVNVLHQLVHSFLLEKPVDEGHLLTQMVIENDPTDGGVHVLLAVLDRFGMENVLIVESVDQIDYPTAVVQFDRR